MPPKKYFWHNTEMPRTKTCPRPAPTPAPPPPHSPDSEPDYGDPADVIPTSIVIPKSPPKKTPRLAARAAAAAIANELSEEEKPIRARGDCSSIVVAEPMQHFGPPFLRGQIGKVFFTNRPVNSLDRMPEGSSFVVAAFRLATNREQALGCKYVLIDTYNGQWAAPPVFNEWRQAVEEGSLPELDFNTIRLALTKSNGWYSLCSSKRSVNYKDAIIPLPSFRTDKL